MNATRIRSIVIKDLREVLANKMAVLPMLVVPLVFCLGMPLAVVLGGFLMGSGLSAMNGQEVIEEMISLYAVPASFRALNSRMVYVFVNYSFAAFFVIIPIMVSTIVTANAVSGEKERKTLETLLSTPVTSREFVSAKVLAGFLPAYAFSLVSFALYVAAADAASLAVAGVAVIGWASWVPLLVVVCPAASFLGIAVTLIASIKAKTFMEAQQMSALVVLPCVAFVAVQMTGLVVMSPLAVTLGGVAVLGLDAVLALAVAPRFERERIIATL